MKRSLFTTTLLLFCLMQTMSQELVSFQFNTTPYLSPKTHHEHFTISPLGISSGSISTQQTTGSYFTDEPYIKASSGWTATEFADAKKLYFTCLPIQNYSALLSVVEVDVYVTATGPTRLGLLIDGKLCDAIDIPSSKLQTVSFELDTVITGEATIEIAGWQGSRKTSGGGVLRVDNLTLLGTLMLLDDKTPPELISVDVIDSTRLKFQFSEGIDSTCLQSNNFSVPTYMTTSVEFTSVDHTAVLSTFSTPFPSYTELTAIAKNIQDTTSNILTSDSLPFTYYHNIIKRLKVVTSQSVLIEFAPVPLSQAILTSDNYQIIGSLLKVNDITEQKEIPNTYVLKFDGSIPEGILLTLQTDIGTGDQMKLLTTTFQYNPPNWGDVLVTEIMCDVNPVPAHLPESEYIELYNTTDRTIDLEGWFVLRDNYTTPLSGEIPAKDYIIVCQDFAQKGFEVFGHITSGLSSSFLTSTDGLIQVVSSNNRIITEEEYHIATLNDKVKAAGGWSIERTNLTLLCQHPDNWRFTTSYLGGTPGQPNTHRSLPEETDNLKVVSCKILSKNSLLVRLNKAVLNFGVMDSIIFAGQDIGWPKTVAFTEASKAILLTFETTFPEGEKVELFLDGIRDRCIDNYQLSSEFMYAPFHLVTKTVYPDRQMKLVFSEALASESCLPINFTLLPEGVQPKVSFLDKDDDSVVHLIFEQAFHSDITHTLRWKGIQNKQLEVVPTDSTIFLIHPVLPNDIVINEVLTYPNVGETRFIELYNRSGLSIDLSTVYLENTTTDAFEAIALTQEVLLFPPNSFLVLAPDTSLLKSTYPIGSNCLYIELNDFPTYDKASALIRVVDRNSTVVDMLEYKSTAHFGLFTDHARGVALERVNYSKATNEQGNWQSAAETVGYATPGAVNSQWSDDAIPQDELFVLENESFSPNNDGYRDYLHINYQLEQAGAMVNIRIFDTKGVLVKHLENNTLLNLNGTIKWDGTNEANQLLSIGIYLVYIELIGVDDVVFRDKKCCVLGLSVR